jgi:hypothetical protein
MYIITLKFHWMVACSLCFNGWTLIHCSKREAEQVIDINEGILWNNKRPQTLFSFQSSKEGMFHD